MADVSVRMGVSGISQFTQAMQQAQNSVKTIDAALKKNEAQFKATGNAQDYMGQKADLLKQKLASQKSAAANASQALAQMVQNGVDPASREYQRLAQSMLNAETAAIETETQINNLGTASAQSATQTDALAGSLQGLNKKVSLQQVISGIDSITKGMEKAAKKAVELGKGIWDNIMDSAQWADNTATASMMLGIDVETYQRMAKVAATTIDTPVEAIVKGQKRLKKSIGEMSSDTQEALRQLGIGIREGGSVWQNNYSSLAMRNAEDVFWDVGEAIMNMTDEFEQEAMAQKLLGRSWNELIPLFTAGREEYEKALDSQTVNTEEEVQKLADLNDEVGKLKGNFETLENKVLAGLAPALTKASEILSGLLEKLMEYLDSPEGQEALGKMGDAVEKMFSKLGEIDPDKVVSGVAEVFGKISDAFTWISDHWEAVVTGIKAIAVAFGGLKIATLGLNIANAVSGLKGLLGGGGGDGTGGGGGEAGAAGAGAAKTGIFAKAGAALKAGFAANGLWALTPAAFLAVGLAPGIALDKKLEEQYVNQYNKSNEVISEAEQNDKVDKALIRIAKATTEAILPSGTGTNAFGFINLNNTDAINKAIGTFGIRSYENMWKDLFAQYYEYDNIHGWSIDAMIKRARGEAVTDSTGMHEIVPMDDQDRSALAEAMNKVLIRALEDEYQYDPYALSRSKNGIQRRELPNGWAYDEFGDVYNISTGKHLGGGNEHGQWAYWDDARYQEWFNEENAKYAEESSTAIQESAGKISDAADKMGGLPEAVAAAVSGIKLSVEFSLFGGKHANGLAYVPFDGYMAMLHKGERVMTARENAASRSYNSNLYVESMYMNNGTDAEGLAAAMAAAQQRTMSGYGS